MALTKVDLITLYNALYAPDSSGPVSWDGVGKRGDQSQRQIIAILLNILSAVDSSFAPPGGGQNAAGLTNYTSGTHAIAAGTYVEVSIFVTTGSAGTIEGTSVIAGNNYVYRADTGKTLDEVNFVVSSGTFQVLTLAA